jgi:hypothetical protein
MVYLVATGRTRRTTWIDPLHALLVFLAHGGDVGVDLLPAARDVAARGLLGPDAPQDFHHVRVALRGLHEDADSPGR